MKYDEMFTKIQEYNSLQYKIVMKMQQCNHVQYRVTAKRDEVQFCAIAAVRPYILHSVLHQQGMKMQQWDSLQQQKEMKCNLLHQKEMKKQQGNSVQY